MTKDTTLVGGPYQVPRYRVGKPLACLTCSRYCRLVPGYAIVEGLTRTPIPWPYATAYGGKRSLILTGDLVRAVAVESVLAICHHWGVSRSTATRWRRSLGVGRWTVGTRDLWRRQWPVRLGLEAARKGGAATRRKHAANRSGT